MARTVRPGAQEAGRQGHGEDESSFLMVSIFSVKQEARPAILKGSVTGETV